MTYTSAVEIFRLPLTNPMHPYAMLNTRGNVSMSAVITSHSKGVAS